MKRQKQGTLSRRTFLGMCGGLAAQSTLCFSAGASDTPKTFRAGTAIRDITPKTGVSLAGHFRDRQATHVHDPLQVRCLVLDDSTTQLVLVMVDSCMVPRDLFDAAKKVIHHTLGIPLSNMLMAATHTHTAPSSVSIFQSDPVPGYAELVKAALVEGVCEAYKCRVPAQIAWGSGAVSDEVFNRRWFMKPGTLPANPFGETTDRVRMNPPRASEDLIESAGSIDPEIPFIAVRHKNGKPLAILANYALHYVGGTDAGAMSADYFGCFAASLTQLLRAAPDETPFLAMLSNGASANINNIDFSKPGSAADPYEQMNAVADKAAQEVYRVYQTLTFSDWLPLAAATRDLMLGTRRPQKTELLRAQSIVDAASSEIMKSTEEVFARETLLLKHYPEQVSVPLQVLRIGDIAIAAIPCEIFVETGLYLKKESPFPHAFPIALANGYNGYLPTAEQHALGGYETWRARSSYLEIHAAKKIQDNIIDMLQVLHT